MSTTGVSACDVVVVGAGPAGLSAALRAAELGAAVVLVTRGVPGGRLRHAEAIPILDGTPLMLTGHELIERALECARRLGIRVESGEARKLAARASGTLSLTLDRGRLIEARSSILATGMERRLEHIDGADRLLGTGVFTHPPDARAPSLRRGDAFVVAGDPEETVRSARVLARSCESVTVLTPETRVHRVLPANASAVLGDRPNVRVLTGTALVGVEGTTEVEVVLLRQMRTGRLHVREAASVWLVGAERSRTDWLPPLLGRDPSGRIMPGRQPGALSSETAMQGVFAAGDVRAGSPHGLGVMADGADAADQAHARLALEIGSAA